MLKIGEFSRLSRVTVKTLHYYDGIGLLNPSQKPKLFDSLSPGACFIHTSETENPPVKFTGGFLFTDDQNYL